MASSTTRSPHRLGSSLAVLLVAAALLVASPLAFGQAQTGNIFGKVTDEQGLALPGVAVTLSGITAPISTVTNNAGDFRFINLGPTTGYVVTCALSGFATVKRTNVTVAVAQNTQLTIALKLSGVATEVMVAGESPLLDVRRSGATAVVPKVELESIPTARDPWVILQTAPGVQIDRVNVGGSESGQQSLYVGKGANPVQGTWNVDGVNITDMGALGSSPTYYDFDAFAEMNVTTGGADASIQTPGVQLNMVTKRGTNDVHGSARVLISDRKLQSENISDELAAQLARNNVAAIGNQLDSSQDYGVEMGGPLIKDKLWLWGSYGRNQINNIVASGYPDRTQLTGFGGKLTAQVIPENSFTAVYSNNDKKKQGRSAAPNRPPETTWDQQGPTKLYKLEDSHIFSPDVFATVAYSRVLGGFQLVAEGQGQTYYDENAIWHSGFVNYYTDRPQTQFTVTPSFFMRTGNVGHEFKVGFNYRKTPIGSISSWPKGLIGWAGAGYGTPSGQDLASFMRDRVAQTDQLYYSGFISDTMTIDKLTLNVGVRYDYQKSTNEAVVVPCCLYSTTDFPEVGMTSINAPATDPLIWKDFAPRASLTYAIDTKTLVRASYARFVDQLGGTVPTFNSTAPTGTSYLYYYWNDKNGNHLVEKGEVDFAQGLYSSNYIDPAHPNAAVSINKIDPNLKAPKTDEFILGFEREVMPAFVLGLSGTYRYGSDYVFRVPMSADQSRILTPADFNCTQSAPYPVPGGSPQSFTICNPKAGVASNSARLQMNRPGYNTTYWGIDFAATKRYSDKWMARFNFTYSNNTQHGLEDGVTDPSNLQPGTEADGGVVLYGAGTGSGSKQYVWIQSRWQANLSAMYTLPLDFNVSTSVFAREGYPNPYYVRLSAGGLPGFGYPIFGKPYQLGGVDDVRLPTVLEWDLGFSKVIRAGGLSITLMADVFNVLNRNTVLQRTLRVYSPAGAASNTDSRDNNIYEQQAPRIWRLGGRLSF